MTDSIPALREQLAQLRAKHEAGALGEQQYASRKAALERKLLDAVMAAPAASAPAPTMEVAPRAGGKMVAGLLVAVVAIAGVGYWWKGTPQVIGTPPSEMAEGGATHATDPAEIEALATKLADRMKETPDDAEGWAMLGRTYMALGRHDDAYGAYERALKLLPNDANALADMADVAAVRAGRNLDGEPTKMLERALKIEPDNLKALALAGTGAFNRGDFAGAVKYWDRAVAVGPADHPIVGMARSGATEARERGKLGPATGAAAAGTTAKPAAAGNPPPAAAGGITGTVRLAAALQSQVGPDDIVFIYARPAEGSRAPLAILRKQVKDLPATFVLDDSLAMSEGARISAAGRVVVGARISKSGQAMPQSGDLEGVTAPVTVGTQGLVVEIATKRP